ncbi:hypothetical protein Pcinc_012441 [Petrolisthes cinctipes]|uniref:Uncharacterized protein n=1 Tax=Petrolisthes cinctipes TaxID=88211 RepID=A0AAE1G0R3_PETCI|nr:hypothetical protein Pcinc_012441 [Petrolisthes cinctipes]
MVIWQKIADEYHVEVRRGTSKSELRQAVLDKLIEEGEIEHSDVAQEVDVLLGNNLGGGVILTPLMKEEPMKSDPEADDSEKAVEDDVLGVKRKGTTSSGWRSNTIYRKKEGRGE